jgi:Schwannomin-interacting protein 1
MNFSFPPLQRKNDREAIRRRLAMGEEDDYFTNLAASRPVRKPNLQSRLQNGSYKSCD